MTLLSGTGVYWLMFYILYIESRADGVIRNILSCTVSSVLCRYCNYCCDCHNYCFVFTPYAYDIHYSFWQDGDVDLSESNDYLQLVCVALYDLHVVNSLNETLSNHERLSFTPIGGIAHRPSTWTFPDRCLFSTVVSVTPVALWWIISQGVKVRAARRWATWRLFTAFPSRTVLVSRPGVLLSDYAAMSTAAVLLAQETVRMLSDAPATAGIVSD